MTTHGQAIRQSPVIRGAIDAIVDEIRSKTADLVDVRPPQPGLVTSYDELVKAAGDSRGWPLLYPMLGSGAGNGVFVELADGSVKWDLVAGIGVHFFGHSNPTIVRAQLEASLDDTVKHGNLQSGTLPYEFAKRFVKLAGRKSPLKYAYLTTSGAMANECALRICMQKRSPGHRVLAFENCFMGRSLVMTSIGDNAAARDGLPVNTAVDYIPFWSDAEAARIGKTKHIDAVLRRLDEVVARYPNGHACFVMELVQGEGGFNVPPREFLEELMKACKRYGIPVWDDEIQSFGRTTQMFAFEHYDLGQYVDVFCVGKMTHSCAALWTEEMKPKPGLLSGTFTGSSVDFTVGLTVLDQLENGGFYGENGMFAQHHAAFRAQAEALIAKHPEWFPKTDEVTSGLGGVGGMMRLTPFGGAKDKIMAAAKAIYAEGAITFWCGHGPYHLRLLPPLPVLKLEHWPRIFEVIERGLAKAA